MNELIDDLLSIYDGLPWWVMPIYWVALAVVLSSALSLVILVVRAQWTTRAVEGRRGRVHKHDARDPDAAAGADPAADEAHYLWLFVVPAMNEEVTIADSVGRLAEVEVTHKRMIVVNDGSTDRTGEILGELAADVPELTVLTRVKPEAQQGKSEVLNAAWRYAHAEVLARGEYRGWDPARVIMVIVDADGRLDPQAGRIARHFADERVGGVQALVRIYNRRSFLTWAQDIEFSVFGHVYQMGRMGWGTANMGGNGQFNRLSALDEIAEVAVQGDAATLGPWRRGRLTEDQDLGLRLIEAGWRGGQSTTVSINQQGLNSLRALLRQRTRWSQGGWQMLDLVGPMARNPHCGFVARWDQFWYLMTPLLLAYLGVTLALTAVMLLTGITVLQTSGIVFLLIYALSIVPSIISVVSARRSLNPLRFIVSFFVAHLFVAYQWLVYPVVFRALVRHIVGRNSWAKTRREQLTRREQRA